MCEYYIKIVWGPSNGYPKDRIHFTKESHCFRFSGCKGFLLYEDGKKWKKKRGSKSIYAQGVIDKKHSDCFDSSIRGRGKTFPYAVKVNIKKRVNPEKGIPLEKMRKITGIKRNIQRQGGLIGITKKQYEKLCKELKFCEG